eukprot:gene4767-3428_t
MSLSSEEALLSFHEEGQQDVRLGQLHPHPPDSKDLFGNALGETLPPSAAAVKPPLSAHGGDEEAGTHQSAREPHPPPSPSEHHRPSEPQRSLEQVSAKACTPTGSGAGVVPQSDTQREEKQAAERDRTPLLATREVEKAADERPAHSRRHPGRTPNAIVESNASPLTELERNEIAAEDVHTKRRTAELLKQLLEVFNTFGLVEKDVGSVEKEVALAVGISVDRVKEILQAEFRNFPRVYYRDYELIVKAATCVGLLDEHQHVNSLTLRTLEDKKEALSEQFRCMLQLLNRRNNARTRTHIISAVTHVSDTEKKLRTVLPRDRVHMLHWRCEQYGAEVMAEAFVEAHRLDGLSKNSSEAQWQEAKRRAESAVAESLLYNTIKKAEMVFRDASARRKAEAEERAKAAEATAGKTGDELLLERKEQEEAAAAAAAAAAAVNEEAPREPLNAADRFAAVHRVHERTALCRGLCVKVMAPHADAEEDEEARVRQSSACPPAPLRFVHNIDTDEDVTSFLLTEGQVLHAIHVDVIGARYAFIKTAKLDEIVSEWGASASDVTSFDIERNTSDQQRRIIFFSKKNEKVGTYKLKDLWGNGIRGECHVVLLNTYYGASLPKHHEAVGIPVFMIRTIMLPPDPTVDEGGTEGEKEKEVEPAGGENAPESAPSSGNEPSKTLKKKKKTSTSDTPLHQAELQHDYVSYTFTDEAVPPKRDPLDVEFGLYPKPSPRPTLFYIKDTPGSESALCNVLNDVFPFFNVGPAAKNLLNLVMDHFFDPDLPEEEEVARGSSPPLSGEDESNSDMDGEKKEEQEEELALLKEKQPKRPDIPPNAYYPEHLQEMAAETHMTPTEFWYCPDENPGRAYPLYLDQTAGEDDGGAGWFIFTSLGQVQVPPERKADLHHICRWDPGTESFQGVTAETAPPGAAPTDEAAAARAAADKKIKRPGLNCPTNSFFHPDLEALNDGVADATEYWYCTNTQKKKAYPMYITPIGNHLWLFYTAKGQQRIPAARKKDLKFLYTWTREDGFAKVHRGNAPLGAKPGPEAPAPPPGWEGGEEKAEEGDEEREEQLPPTAFFHPDLDQLVEDNNAESTAYWYCAALGKKPVYRIYLVDAAEEEEAACPPPEAAPAAVDGDGPTAPAPPIEGKEEGAERKEDKASMSEERCDVESAPDTEEIPRSETMPAAESEKIEGIEREAGATEDTQTDEDGTVVKAKEEAPPRKRNWMHFTTLGAQLLPEDRKRDLRHIYTWSEEEGFRLVTFKMAPPGAISVEEQEQEREPERAPAIAEQVTNEAEAMGTSTTLNLRQGITLSSLLSSLFHVYYYPPFHSVPRSLKAPLPLRYYVRRYQLPLRYYVRRYQLPLRYYVRRYSSFFNFSGRVFTILLCATVYAYDAPVRTSFSLSYGAYPRFDGFPDAPLPPQSFVVLHPKRLSRARPKKNERLIATLTNSPVCIVMRVDDNPPADQGSAPMLWKHNHKSKMKQTNKKKETKQNETRTTATQKNNNKGILSKRKRLLYIFLFEYECVYRLYLLFSFYFLFMSAEVEAAAVDRPEEEIEDVIPDEKDEAAAPAEEMEAAATPSGVVEAADVVVMSGEDGEDVPINDEEEAALLEKLQTLLYQYASYTKNLDHEVDPGQEVALAVGIAWERLQALLDHPAEVQAAQAAAAAAKDEAGEGAAKEAAPSSRYLYTTYREKALIGSAYDVLHVPVDQKKEELEKLFQDLMKTLGKHNNAKKRSTVISAVARVNEIHRRMLRDIPTGKIHMLYWRAVKYGLEILADAFVQAHNNIKEIEGKVTKRKIQNRVTPEEAQKEKRMREVLLMETMLFEALKAGEVAYRKTIGSREEDASSSSSSSSSSEDDEPLKQIEASPEQLEAEQNQVAVVEPTKVDPRAAFFAGFRLKRPNGEDADFVFDDGVLIKAIHNTVFAADYIYMKRKKLRELLKISGSKSLAMEEVNFTIDRTVDQRRKGTDKDRQIRFYVRRIQRASCTLFDLLQSNSLLLLNAQFKDDTHVDKAGTPIYILRTTVAEIDEPAEGEEEPMDRAEQERVHEALKARGFSALTKVDDANNEKNFSIDDGSSLVILKHEACGGSTGPAALSETHYLSNLYPFYNLPAAVDDLLEKFAGEDGFFLSDEVLGSDEEEEEAYLMAENSPSQFYFLDVNDLGEKVFHRVYTTTDNVLVYVKEHAEAAGEVLPVFPPEADEDAALAEERLNNIYILITIRPSEEEAAAAAAAALESGEPIADAPPVREQVPVREALLTPVDEFSAAADVIIYHLVQRFKAVPHPETEPEPEAEAEAAPEADPEAAPEGGAEAAPEADPEAAPEADPEAAPEADPEAAPEGGAEAAPEADPEAAPEADPEAAPEGGAEAAPEADPEAAPEADPEAAPEGGAEAAPEADPEAAPEVDPEAAPEADPEAAPEGGAEAAPEADPEAAPEADPEAAPEGGAEAAPEADPEAAPEADPEAAPEGGAEAENENNNNPQDIYFHTSTAIAIPFALSPLTLRGKKQREKKETPPPKKKNNKKIAPLSLSLAYAHTHLLLGLLPLPSPSSRPSFMGCGGSAAAATDSTLSPAHSTRPPLQPAVGIPLPSPPQRDDTGLALQERIHTDSTVMSFEKGSAEEGVCTQAGDGPASSRPYRVPGVGRRLFPYPTTHTDDAFMIQEDFAAKEADAGFTVTGSSSIFGSSSGAAPGLEHHQDVVVGQQLLEVLNINTLVRLPIQSLLLKVSKARYHRIAREQLQQTEQRGPLPNSARQSRTSTTDPPETEEPRGAAAAPAETICSTAPAETICSTAPVQQHGKSAEDASSTEAGTSPLPPRHPPSPTTAPSPRPGKEIYCGGSTQEEARYTALQLGREVALMCLTAQSRADMLHRSLWSACRLWSHVLAPLPTPPSAAPRNGCCARTAPTTTPPDVSDGAEKALKHVSATEAGTVSGEEVVIVPQHSAVGAAAAAQMETRRRAAACEARAQEKWRSIVLGGEASHSTSSNRRPSSLRTEPMPTKAVGGNDDDGHKRAVPAIASRAAAHYEKVLQEKLLQHLDVSLTQREAHKVLEGFCQSFRETALAIGVSECRLLDLYYAAHYYDSNVAMMQRQEPHWVILHQLHRGMHALETQCQDDHPAAVGDAAHGGSDDSVEACDDDTQPPWWWQRHRENSDETDEDAYQRTHIPPVQDPAQEGGGGLTASPPGRRRPCRSGAPASPRGDVVHRARGLARRLGTWTEANGSGCSLWRWWVQCGPLLARRVFETGIASCMIQGGCGRLGLARTADGRSSPDVYVKPRREEGDGRRMVVGTPGPREQRTPGPPAAVVLSREDVRLQDATEAAKGKTATMGGDKHVPPPPQLMEQLEQEPLPGDFCFFSFLHEMLIAYEDEQQRNGFERRCMHFFEEMEEMVRCRHRRSIAHEEDEGHETAATVEHTMTPTIATRPGDADTHDSTPQKHKPPSREEEERRRAAHGGNGVAGTNRCAAHHVLAYLSAASLDQRQTEPWHHQGGALCTLAEARQVRKAVVVSKTPLHQKRQQLEDLYDEVIACIEAQRHRHPCPAAERIYGASTRCAYHVADALRDGTLPTDALHRLYWRCRAYGTSTVAAAHLAAVAAQPFLESAEKAQRSATKGAVGLALPAAPLFRPDISGGDAGEGGGGGLDLYHAAFVAVPEVQDLVHGVLLDAVRGVGAEEQHLYGLSAPLRDPFSNPFATIRNFEAFEVLPLHPDAADPAGIRIAWIDRGALHTLVQHTLMERQNKQTEKNTHMAKLSTEGASTAAGSEMKGTCSPAANADESSAAFVASQLERFCGQLCFAITSDPRPEAVGMTEEGPLTAGAAAARSTSESMQYRGVAQSAWLDLLHTVPSFLPEEWECVLEPEMVVCDEAPAGEASRPHSSRSISRRTSLGTTLVEKESTTALLASQGKEDGRDVSAAPAPSHPYRFHVLLHPDAERLEQVPGLDELPLEAVGRTMAEADGIRSLFPVSIPLLPPSPHPQDGEKGRDGGHLSEGGSLTLSSLLQPGQLVLFRTSFRSSGGPPAPAGPASLGTALAPADLCPVGKPAPSVPAAQGTKVVPPMPEAPQPSVREVEEEETLLLAVLERGLGCPVHTLWTTVQEACTFMCSGNHRDAPPVDDVRTGCMNHPPNPCSVRTPPGADQPPQRPGFYSSSCLWQRRGASSVARDEADAPLAAERRPERAASGWQPLSSGAPLPIVPVGPAVVDLLHLLHPSLETLLPPVPAAPQIPPLLPRRLRAYAMEVLSFHDGDLGEAALAIGLPRNRLVELLEIPEMAGEMKDDAAGDRDGPRTPSTAQGVSNASHRLTKGEASTSSTTRRRPSPCSDTELLLLLDAVAVARVGPVKRLWAVRRLFDTVLEHLGYLERRGYREVLVGRCRPQVEAMRRKLAGECPASSTEEAKDEGLESLVRRLYWRGVKYGVLGMTEAYMECCNVHQRKAQKRASDSTRRSCSPSDREVLTTILSERLLLESLRQVGSFGSRSLDGGTEGGSFPCTNTTFLVSAEATAAGEELESPTAGLSFFYSNSSSSCVCGEDGLAAFKTRGDGLEAPSTPFSEYVLLPCRIATAAPVRRLASASPTSLSSSSAAAVLVGANGASPGRRDRRGGSGEGGCPHDGTTRARCPPPTSTPPFTTGDAEAPEERDPSLLPPHRRRHQQQQSTRRSRSAQSLRAATTSRTSVLPTPGDDTAPGADAAHHIRYALLSKRIVMEMLQQNALRLHSYSRRRRSPHHQGRGAPSPSPRRTIVALPSPPTDTAPAVSSEVIDVNPHPASTSCGGTGSLAHTRPTAGTAVETEEAATQGTSASASASPLLETFALHPTGSSRNSSPLVSAPNSARRDGGAQSAAAAAPSLSFKASATPTSLLRGRPHTCRMYGARRGHSTPSYTSLRSPSPSSSPQRRRRRSSCGHGIGSVLLEDTNQELGIPQSTAWRCWRLTLLGPVAHDAPPTSQTTDVALAASCSASGLDRGQRRCGAVGQRLRWSLPLCSLERRSEILLLPFNAAPKHPEESAQEEEEEEGEEGESMTSRRSRSPGLTSDAARPAAPQDHLETRVYLHPGHTEAEAEAGAAGTVAQLNLQRYLFRLETLYCPHVLSAPLSTRDSTSPARLSSSLRRRAAGAAGGGGRAAATALRQHNELRRRLRLSHAALLYDVRAAAEALLDFLRPDGFGASSHVEKQQQQTNKQTTEGGAVLNPLYRDGEDINNININNNNINNNNNNNNNNNQKWLDTLDSRLPKGKTIKSTSYDYSCLCLILFNIYNNLPPLTFLKVSQYYTMPDTVVVKFVGPEGCGKSVLARTLYLLLPEVLSGAVPCWLNPAEEGKRYPQAVKAAVDRATKPQRASDAAFRPTHLLLDSTHLTQEERHASFYPSDATPGIRVVYVLFDHPEGGRGLERDACIPHLTREYEETQRRQKGATPVHPPSLPAGLFMWQTGELSSKAPKKENVLKRLLSLCSRILLLCLQFCFRSVVTDRQDRSPLAKLHDTALANVRQTPGVETIAVQPHAQPPEEMVDAVVKVLTRLWEAGGGARREEKEMSGGVCVCDKEVPRPRLGWSGAWEIAMAYNRCRSAVGIPWHKRLVYACVALGPKAYQEVLKVIAGRAAGMPIQHEFHMTLKFLLHDLDPYYVVTIQRYAEAMAAESPAVAEEACGPFFLEQLMKDDRAIAVKVVDTRCPPSGATAPEQSGSADQQVPRFPPMANQTPHVTIATARGTWPVYSNDLLAEAPWGPNDVKEATIPSRKRERVWLGERAAEAEAEALGPADNTHTHRHRHRHRRAVFGYTFPCVKGYIEFR